MHAIDLSDTPYAGTFSSADPTNRTARERRGKYRANKRRLPGWRYNEELDVLLLTPMRKRGRGTGKRTAVTYKADATATRNRLLAIAGNASRSD